MADEPTTPTEFETDSVKGGESRSSAMGNESEGPTQGTDMSVNENVDEQRGADDDALTLDDVISADSVDDSKDKSEPVTSSDVADSGDEAHTASTENGGDETRAEDASEQDDASDQDAPAKETSDKENSDDDASGKESSDKDASTDTDDDEDEGPSFDDLDLSDDVVRAVKKVGFETPSPIQAATIPILAQGRDVVGLAQTGTCLLYTSPSPRDKRQSRMPSSA